MKGDFTCILILLTGIKTAEILKIKNLRFLLEAAAHIV